MPCENLSTRILQLRKENNLKQSELGEAVGLSLYAISDIERGRRTTTTEKIIEIANYFNVTTDYLLGLSNMRERKQHDTPGTAQ